MRNLLGSCRSSKGTDESGTAPRPVYCLTDLGDSSDRMARGGTISLPEGYPIGLFCDCFAENRELPSLAYNAASRGCAYTTFCALPRQRYLSGIKLGSRFWQPSRQTVPEP